MQPAPTQQPAAGSRQPAASFRSQRFGYISLVRSDTLLAIAGLLVLAASLLGFFYLPDQTNKLWYVLVGAVLLAGGFMIGPRVYRFIQEHPPALHQD